MTVRRSSVVAHYQHIVQVLDQRVITLRKVLPVFISLVTVLFVFIPLIVNLVIISKENHQGLVDFQLLGKKWAPAGQAYLGSQNFNFSSSSSAQLIVSHEEPSCVHRLGNDLETLINVTHTSPAVVRHIFNRLRLKDWFPAEEKLVDILSSPQPLAPLIAEITNCAGQNPFLAVMACKLLEKDAVHIRNDEAWMKELVVALHIVLVTDRVTQAAISDLSFALQLFEHVSARHEEATSGGRTETDATVGLDTLEFRKDKYKSVKMALEYEADMRMKGPRSFTLQEQQQVEMSLQLNILQAVMEDVKRHQFSNSNAGLLLASYLTEKGGLSSISPHELGRKFRFEVGKPWADMYVSWNAAFVFSEFSSHSPELAAFKLLVPSVICTERDVGASGFLEARTISLWLSLSANLFTTDSEFVELVQNNVVIHPNLIDEWGDLNLALSPFERPSEDNMMRWMDRLKYPAQGFGYEVPRYSILSYVAGVDFPWVTTSLTWAACVLLGFSCELLVAQHILPQMNDSTAAMWWKFSQVAYSFLMGISVFSRSVFGLPFMVVGLFKCGLPETTGYLAAALRPDITWREYTTNVLNGIGLILHHLAVSWMITGTCTGFTVQDRFLVSTQVPLLVQHLLIILRYHSYTTYTILILVVEAWWQLEITFQLIDVRPPWHWWAASIMILVGHWFFIIAYVIEWVLTLCHGSPTEGHKDLSDIVVINGCGSFTTVQSDAMCATLRTRFIAGDMVYRSRST